MLEMFFSTFLLLSSIILSSSNRGASAIVLWDSVNIKIFRKLRSFPHEKTLHSLYQHFVFVHCDCFEICHCSACVVQCTPWNSQPHPTLPHSTSLPPIQIHIAISLVGLRVCVFLRSWKINVDSVA